MHRATVVLFALLAAAAIVGCADATEEASSNTSTEVAATVTNDPAPMTTADGTSDSTAATVVDSAPDTMVATTADPPVDDARPVVAFPDPTSISGWSNVDDTVMGGVSSSTTSWEEGRMVFAGELSLENNGGFTSVRGPLDPSIGATIADAATLTVDAEGDGRTYVVQLRTVDESLYISAFASVDGVARRYELPLAGFEPVTRFLEPSPGTPPLDASAVVQIAIYLLDKQEGGFRLAVAGISATGISATGISATG